MKKICLIILFSKILLTITSAQNPIIVGLDCDGGVYGKGRLFKINNNYSSVNSLKELVFGKQR